MKENLMPGTLLMCEFHDADFELLSLDYCFSPRLVFSELPCYYSTDVPGVAGIWMHRAELRVANVRSVLVSFPLREAKWVSDLEIVPFNEGAVDHHNLALLQGVHWRSARLILEENASIRIDGGVGKLTIGPRVRFLEQTEWP